MLSSLRYPNERRVRQAVAHLLQERRAARLIDLDTWQYMAERDAKSVTLPEYNVLTGHQRFQVSPLFWLTPEMPRTEFERAWGALADLLCRPAPPTSSDQEAETEALREVLRSTGFRVARARRWLMGPAKEHPKAKILPVMQMLLLATCRIGDQPLEVAEDKITAVIDGKTYWVGLQDAGIPRVWGSPLVYPHGRGPTYLRGDAFDVPPMRVYSRGAAALLAQGIDDPNLLAALHAVATLGLSIDEVLRQELSDSGTKTKAVKTHIRSGSAAPSTEWTPDFESEVEKVASLQACPNIETAFLNGTQMNLAGLYRWLVLDERLIQAQRFRDLFGSPLRSDGSPRVLKVTASERFNKLRGLLMDVLDDAVQAM